MTPNLPLSDGDGAFMFFFLFISYLIGFLEPFIRVHEKLNLDNIILKKYMCMNLTKKNISISVLQVVIYITVNKTTVIEVVI